MPPFENLAKGAFEAIKSALSTDVIYLPKIGGLFKIRGPFDDRAQAVDPDSEQVVSSNLFSLGIKLDDLPAPPKVGDTAKIKNVNYKVVDVQEDGAPDVSVVVILHKDC